MFEIILENDVLAYFGMFCTFILAASLIWKFFNFLRIHLFSKYNCDLKRYGQWAVITGGSSGIGKGYAIELAKLGLDIVIISNELEALKETAEEIKFQYGVRCCYIHVDLTEESVFEFLSRSLTNMDIGILVNSAGIIGNTPCYFLDETDSDVYRLIDLHIRAVVHMTRLILPSMLTRKKGAVVNISSIVSLAPTPYSSLYSSCKAFSDRFTRAISYEYRYENINIQSLIPCAVCTEMVQQLNKKLPSLKLFSIDRDRFVRNAVQTINVADHTTGYWLNDITWYVYLVIPYFYGVIQECIQYRIGKRKIF